MHKLKLLFLFIISCMLFSAAAAQTRTMHALILSDTTNSVTGSGHKANIAKIRAELDTIVYHTGISKKVESLDTRSLTEADLVTKLNNLEIGDNDFIFLYISGTEKIVRIRGYEGHILSLKDEDYIKLPEVREILEGKGAALLITLADLCNNALTFAELDPLQKSNPAVYKALFAEATGKVFASNHVPREQGAVYISPVGGFFTHAFLTELHNRSSSNTNWTTLFNNAKFTAVQSSRGDQNPQLDIEATAGSVDPSDMVSSDEGSDADAEDGGSDGFSGSSSEAGMKFSDNSGDFNPGDGPLSSGDLSLFTDRAQATVKILQDKISQIASGSSSSDASSNESNILDETIALFSSNSNYIEISHLFRRKSRRKVERYFRKLYGLSNRYTIEVNWYQTPDVGPFSYDSFSGKYTTQATIYQEFLKKDRNGEIVYADRVAKVVELILIPEGDSYRVAVGNIGIQDGSTQAVE